MNSMTKVNEYVLNTIGYCVMNFFKTAVDNNKNVQLMLEDEIGYTEYHNFWKCRLPEYWYDDVLSCLGLNTDDVLVEVARIKGSHAKDLHYHKISHAICIVLGPKCGFNPVPYDSAIQIEDKIYFAYEDQKCYFPSTSKHTFYGSLNDNTDEGDLYFLSIQSPPLLTETHDDFYWVDEHDERSEV